MLTRALTDSHYGKRIKSFCGAKPTQKVRWTNAEVEVWAGLYGDFTADAWRLD
jgi:hypothetical protein